MIDRSIIYSIPYIILFIILLFLYYLERNHLYSESEGENNKLKQIRGIGFIVLLVFIGLRGHIYTDFVEYYWMFDRIPAIWNLDVSEFNMESGFVVYTSLFKTIVPNYFAWVFFNTLIDLSVLYLFFKKHTQSVILAFMVFIAYQGLYVEFNLYRNSKAIILFIISLPYLIQRKSIPFFVLNTLGCFFHMGAVLFFPLYFIGNKRCSKQVIWSLFVIANVCFFFKVHFTSEILKYLSGFSAEYLAFKANKYASYSEAYGLSFGYLEKTLIICLIIGNYHRLCNCRYLNTLLCNCAILFYFITYFFADISILTERLSYQYIFAFWLIIPELLYLKGKRSLLNTAIMVLLFLRLVVGNMTSLCYYDNILWGTMDVEKRSIIVSSF